MKKSIIALAASLLFTSISMALSTPGSASEAPIVLPCGKIFTKSVARNDRGSNAYYLIQGKSGSTTPTGSGNTAY